MPQYIAFLRAINVGGHIVKMGHLRGLFEALEFENVETFIASGNVVFDAPAGEPRDFERRIEEHLRESLGYDVTTFIRSTAEVAEIAQYRPFPEPDLTADGNSVYVAFLPGPPAEEARKRLMEHRNAMDDFHVHGREVYWFCRTRMSDSKFSGALLEKTLGMPATMRNVNTIRRLAAKYPPPGVSPT